MDKDADILESPSRKPSVAKYRSWRKAIRVPDFCKSDDNRLHLGLIPVPFMGDMLNASIYVLMLNPGLGPGDYFEYKVPGLRRALLANLRQKRIPGVTPFVFLDLRFAWHDGFGYWNQELKGVIEALPNREVCHRPMLGQRWDPSLRLSILFHIMVTNLIRRHFGSCPRCA